MTWLLSPIGRFLAAVGAIIAAIATIYAKGRADGKAKVENEAVKDALGRTQDAIDAGDAVARDPARLRESDGFRRD
jgi:hypothetical protein